MTCATYGCTAPAEYPFACCGKAHGYDLKQIVHWLRAGNEKEARQYLSIDPATAERELAHYRAFINRNEPHGTTATEEEAPVQPAVQE